MKKKLKILHCPVNVGNQAWGISRGERKLGYQSDCIIFKNSWMQYSCDYDLELNNKNFLKKNLTIFKFFFNAIKKYDVFHFYYAKNILPFYCLYLDLLILKIIGKKVFFTFQGSDIRRRRCFLKHFKIDLYKDSKDIRHHVFFDLFRFLRMKLILLFADKTFILNPDLKLISPHSKMLPYANIDLEEWKIKKSKGDKDQFIILHAPTNRGIKGTDFLIKAVSKIRKEGYNVELKLVKKIENNELKELYKKADVIVDQFLAGWYGGTAVEAMALEKPVICYLNKSLFPFVSWAENIPIINANSKEIEKNLKWLINNPEEREKISKKSREYVEKYHNPVEIAKQLIKHYEE